ncbi:3-oxoacyl-[acyl-carrier-protein] reductase FabG [Pigmentiphaga humi]|uniref:3-oxoacyl-[acyl-carrier-protein] reductase FabG n=1 Tax=Pigmentiphaga humi TaxID=2478468 RepID=A0A3P4AZD6_9BURK|nr:SDR family oxidoreductase [Pigmentiphaga humi]VCU69407.1 3-oxoacyl-[acyl-carrier-protein] reductase FabG [Pigmentiphaga humi]
MTAEYTESLRDRVILVTGGTRGLGREMALALVEAGARVAITGAGPSDAMHETVARAQASVGAGRMFAVAADVTRYEDCARAVAEVCDRFGALHVLINNAGIGMRIVSETFNVEPARFWKTDPGAWRAIVDTNVNGTFNMSRAAAPLMIEQKFGKIINISTSDVTMVRSGYSPYGPSKAAVEAASRAWSQDLAGTGVDVNVYLPGGAADTEFMPGGKAADGGQLLPAAVMRRGILWLCSDASNGQTGGRYVARLWNESLPAEQAAAGARAPRVDKPAIM